MLYERNTKANSHPEDEESNDEGLEVDSSEVKDHVHTEVSWSIEQKVNEETQNDDSPHCSETDVQEAWYSDERHAEEEAVDVEQHEHEGKLLEELEWCLHDGSFLWYQVNQSCDAKQAHLNE